MRELYQRQNHPSASSHAQLFCQSTKPTAWRRNACTKAAARSTRTTTRRVFTTPAHLNSTRGRKVGAQHLNASMLRAIVTGLMELRRLEMLQTSCPDLRRVPGHRALHDRQALGRGRHSRARARQSARRSQWHPGQPWLARGVPSRPCTAPPLGTSRAEAVSLASTSSRIRR